MAFSLFMQNLFSHLLPSLLLFSVHVFSQSPPYNPPYKYFVNCGSPTTVADDTGRNFIGDLNSSVTFTFTSGISREVNHLTNPPSLNDSVRIFDQPAFYGFDIDQDAVHIVRLHFSPFNFPTDVSTALFNVSASGFLLLQNFNPTNIRSSSALVEEFFLSLNRGKRLKVYFLPKSSSIAYVNAIEVFPVPPNFIMSEALQLITDEKKDDTLVLPPPFLHTVYRVNVGGPEIYPRGDKLWRKWEQDDAYLLNPSSAINSSPRTVKPNYLNESDDYFAPDLVYKTAKNMSTNSSSPIRWSFPSRKHTRHLLRVHFYDIVGAAVNNFLVFNLYIGNSFSKKIDPQVSEHGATFPFHNDFLVDSGESGFVNVSVGALGKNESYQTDAYLNGVEIMEVMNEDSKDPYIIEPEKKKNKHLGVGLLVGLIVGSVGLFCIFGCVICFCQKWRKPKIEEAPLTHTKWSPLPVFGGGSTHSRSSSSPIPNLNLGLKFSLAEIKIATNNFNEKFLVGEGGFGKVYKGVMRNGMKVAVKRSQPGAGQGISEFEREITILSRIRHRHLVSFIGYCDEGLEMILV